MKRSTLAGFLLFATCAAEDPKAPTDKVKTFLGTRAFSILASATKVDVFRVNPEKPDDPFGAVCGGYPIISTGKQRDAAFAASMREILFDEKTYDFEKEKKCAFEPGVGYRLWENKDFVEVLICFKCDIIQLVDKAPDAKEPHVATEDCDAARAALVKLAKEAFPDDKEIQELKDKR